MRIYIIRHGETDWNVKGRLQGQSDTKLNENGIRLAKVTAKGMKEISFDLAISSPLKRALDTAKIVLGDRNIPLLTDDRLMELSFGSWEGLGCRKDNFEIPSKDFIRFYEDPLHFQPACDGESVVQLCERTEAFYKELIAKPEYQDKTILIATHGCCMRALLRNVYQDKTDFWHGGVPLNCAVNIIEVEKGNSVLLEEDKVYYGKEDCIDFYSTEK
ncbi:MAG: histidine phosphatase family protein [Fusicatenibacter sp.]|nr:histidine phosphatase family protein [Fusicatenibacter sp.]